MLAIKILYKYLHFRNLITLLFFCMEQGLEFRWIWAILGQISKNSEIKKKTSRSLLLSRKCLNSQKRGALQKLPIYSDFSLLCPIHLLLPTFFLSLRKKRIWWYETYFFIPIHSKKTLSTPHTKLFLWASKNLETDLKIQQNFSPDLWSVQKRVLFYASFIMKAYILFTLLPQKKEENHYFWLHLLPTWWWYRIKLVLAISIHYNYKFTRVSME